MRTASDPSGSSSTWSAAAAVTKSEAGEAYFYAMSFDTIPLTAGVHTVSAVITDSAGNQTTLPAVSTKPARLSTCRS